MSNIFGSVAYSLMAATAWGSADYCGGLASRKGSAPAIVALSQLSGGLLLAALALAWGEALPSASDLLWGAAAGVAGNLGLLALYQALASGRMGVAAPVSATLAAALPVGVSALVEGAPGPVTLIGFGLALTGVWLLSRPDLTGVRRAELLLPLGAGVCFGLFFVLLRQVSLAAVFWPLVASRSASVLAMGGVMLFRREPVKLPLAVAPLAAFGGALDAGGNLFYALALRAGRLDVAAVLASLYPAATTFLAWRLLGEKLDRRQLIGLAAALLAIALIAL